MLLLRVEILLILLLKSYCNYWGAWCSQKITRTKKLKESCLSIETITLRFSITILTPKKLVNYLHIKCVILTVVSENSQNQNFTLYFVLKYPLYFLGCPYGCTQYLYNIVTLLEAAVIIDNSIFKLINCFILFTELDDGSFNPLWTMRGFTQTFHLWKENKRTQSIPLNAFVTYVTLPWWSIAKGNVKFYFTNICSNNLQLN